MDFYLGFQGFENEENPGFRCGGVGGAKWWNVAIDLWIHRISSAGEEKQSSLPVL